MNLENTVNTARDIFDKAYKKTEDIVNIEKLRVDIAALKVKRDKDFKELGKLKYKELTGNTVNEYEVKSLSDSITDKNKRIKRYEELIKLYKNKDTTVNSVNFDNLK